MAPGRTAGGKEGGEAGRVSAGSQPQPGKHRRNWAQRAAVCPCASCGSVFSEGGHAAAPSAVFRATEVSRQKGQEARKGRGQRGPPGTWKPLEALKTPAPAPSQSATATHPQPPRPQSPKRTHTSSSDPTPHALLVRPAEWGVLGFVSGAPTTSQQHCRGSGKDCPFPDPWAPRSPKTVANGSGLLPRPVSRSQLVAECGSILGSPEIISGDHVGTNSSSPWENALRCCGV